ncbi:proteasome assembly chaperone 3-like [Halichondria panicea]|uniref:proteasome assembly chaperone 3-like n=1 Tax=Halichondria panicea TaxID=6063 RepID=UPI00312B938E
MDTQFIKTLQERITVNELDIDVVCSNFGDQILLVVSQVQKFGTLMEVRCDPVLAGSSSHSFSVRTLLGKDKPEVHVFGRAIAGHLSLPTNTPLLLALGLRDHSPSLIPPLLKELEKLKMWEPI